MSLIQLLKNYKCLQQTIFRYFKPYFFCATKLCVFIKGKINVYQDKNDNGRKMGEFCYNICRINHMAKISSFTVY